MNRAAGVNQIPAKFLKEVADVLDYSPSRIINNLSMKLTVFPEECKIAKLRPQFKAGSKTCPKNCRYATSASSVQNY